MTQQYIDQFQQNTKKEPSAYRMNYDQNFNMESTSAYEANYSTTSSPVIKYLNRIAFLLFFLVLLVGFVRYRRLINKKRKEYRSLSLPVNGKTTPSAYKDTHKCRRSNAANPPSPRHPALERVPTFSIRLETMKILRLVGVRLIAHGIKSKPRRIWISIDDKSIIWQSEYKSKLPNNAGASSLLSVRGPLHRLDWKVIKYIDVGKNTSSLRLVDGIRDDLCLSILTTEGSLDVQAKSKLERDSLVSCFGTMLDEYNNEDDWRGTYSFDSEEDPSSSGIASLFYDVDESSSMADSRLI